MQTTLGGGNKKKKKERKAMRQLSVRRAASRFGDIIRPQSRSTNFTPLLSARQITSRTTWNPFVFGQYAEKSLEARHVRRGRISRRGLPFRNIAGFIQVVPLISEQEREKGTRSKAQDVDSSTSFETKDQM